MNKVELGILAALLFLNVNVARVQQSSDGNLVSGMVVSGPISGQVMTGQPVTSGGVSMAPGVPGTLMNGPVVLGENVGQPVVTGEILTVLPASTAITTYPAQGQLLPYSYWVTAPQPARIYVEYGPNDQFPFYGRPYGSPSDRWSWYSMGGGGNRYLARYYYPPLQ